MKCSLLDYIQLLMISRANRGKKDDQDAKKWKRPLSHQKIKCLFFNYINFWWSAEQSEQKTLTKTKKNKQKRSLSHWKIKCLFLDYVQLLMISWAIWGNNIDQNPKKWKRPSKSLKNEMFIFGLRSTSDDRPSDPSKKCWPKHKKKQKRPHKSLKNKMFVLDYIQLLMIGQAIQAKNVDWNVKKTKKAP